MRTSIRTRRSPETELRWKSAFAVAFTSLALILALGSYHAEDPSLNTFASAWKDPQNVLGYFGSFVADLFFQALGYGAWLCPLLGGVALARWLSRAEKHLPVLSFRDSVALGLLLSAQGLLFSLTKWGATGALGFPPQGLLGVALTSVSIPLFGRIGSYLSCALLLWFFCMVWWEELPLLFVRGLHRTLAFAWLLCRNACKKMNLKPPSHFHLPKWKLSNWNFPKISWDRKSAEAPTELVVASAPISLKVPIEEESEDVREENDALEEAVGNKVIPFIRSAKSPESFPERKQRERKTAPTEGPVNWSLPPLSLLQSPKLRVKGPAHEQLLETAKKISNALKSFEIEGDVVEITPGPIITMYEFQPAPGVRVQKLISASTDLAMTLGVPSVRIVAPIPGKSVAGIEVPNLVKEEIVLKDVYEQTLERAKGQKLPLVLGKDGEGTPVVEDLSRMPHLLVGGATSMGKSVLVNSMLTSLLCRFTPTELRLIIVDPKLVEFKIFEDIPHLLLPIVNDPNDASQALKWAVAETKRRYVELQRVSAKNLESYNQKIAQLPSDQAPLEKIPYIVIIVDELAELMLTAKKDVEQSIVRLSQLARAAGIHLIMATQRPSADVVTGLIKSNCPSRAALRVASASDSRIILDCSGAEQLLGKGDMFFTNTGPMGLKRMQGCFVSDEEIERICNFWRDQGEPAYREEILAPELEAFDEDEESGSGNDALYEDVLNFAREKGKVSTSLIQRRFQIGYTRAARIMDQLERRGVVGEATVAGKPRDVIL